jgi:hypothetical protein
VYEVPANYYLRLHHSRPRFKSDVESVLLFVAEAISGQDHQPDLKFKSSLNRIIRTFPGNATRSDKTINNWRTEISSLFAFVRSDGEWSSPTNVAKNLASSGDLVALFRNWCVTFQYPGGHLKPHVSADLISHGVRFSPAVFLLRLLASCQERVERGQSFGLTAPEVAHLVFNDIRVTGTQEYGPDEVAEALLENRRRQVAYDATGDTVRYAKDVLDYMVLAQLLNYRPANATFSLRPQSQSAAQNIVAQHQPFTGYDKLYGSVPDPGDVAAKSAAWVDYVNQPREFLFDESLREPDVAAEESTGTSSAAAVIALLDGIQRAMDGTTADIGRFGEQLTIVHERERLRRLGRRDLAQLVRKIPESMAAGYDVKSFDGVLLDGFDLDRLIEVKTTRSARKDLQNFFTMTPNEWSVARTSRDAYFVYRIFITPEGVDMFVLRNPYQLDADGLISMEPRRGAEIRYAPDAGEWVAPLIPLAIA